MARRVRVKLPKAGTHPPANEPAGPSAQGPSATFRKLEALEQELDQHVQSGQHRWMIPYADLLTLLLGLFLVLFASNGLYSEAGQTPVAEASSAVNVPLTPDAADNAPAVSVDAAPTDGSAESTHAADAQLQEQLTTQLEETLPLSDIEVFQQERGVVISLKDNILFAPGQAELSAPARQTLDTLIGQLDAALGDDPRPIRVEGHTDNTPITTAKYPSNWELSTARATNIVRHLIDGHQFAPQRLSAAGYGEYKPVADNSSIEGKQKNRRVDIVVLNNQTARQEPPVDYQED